MARAIPTYQRQNLAQGIQSAPNASSSVSASDPMAGAIGNLAQVAGAAANTLAEEATRNANDLRQQTEKAALEAKRSVENAAAVDVANVLSQGDPFWQEKTTRMMQAWKVGDPDMREGIGTDFDKWVAESTAKLPTDASKKYFQQHAASMKARLQTNAFTFQEKSAAELRAVTTAEAERQDQEQVYNDEKRFKDITDRRIATIRARTGSQADKVKEENDYLRGMAEAAERGEAARDPVGWYARRFGPVAPAAAVAPVSRTEANGVVVTPVRTGSVQGSDLAPLPMAGDPNLPAGMRNNNPGNIKYVGQAGTSPSVNKDQGDPQAVYASADEGMAAMFTLALKKYDGGKTTANSLIAGQNGWTPGNTAAAANVARAMGLSPDDNLNLRDPAKLKEFARALMQQEHGKASRAYGDDMVSRIADDVLAGRKVQPGPSSPAPGAAAPSGGAPVTRRAVLDTAPATFRFMDWKQQDAMIAMNETRLRQDHARLQADFDMKIRDATAMHADGKVDPFNFAQETFTQFYGADGVRRYKDYQNGQVLAADISSYMTMSPAQIEASLQANQELVNGVAAGGGSGYAAADARQQLRIRSAQAVVKMQQDDPQAYAVKAGISSAKPLDMGNPQKFGVELAGRAATAAMLRDAYKTPYTLLMKGEAASLSAGFNKMTSEQKLAYLGTIAKSVTDPMALASVFQQIAPDSPVTAVAGKLMTMTGSSPIGAGMFSSGTTYNPQTVATMIIQGEAILNPSKAAKKEDGKPVNMVMPKEQDLRSPFNTAVGKAFVNQGDSADVAYGSVKAYYAAKMVQLGDYSGEFNSKAMKEAIEAVTGGGSEFRDTMVIRPWGMDDAAFKNNAKTAFDAEMKRLGRKGPAANFASYGLENFGDAYRVRAGTGYVQDETGRPLTLNVTGPSFAGAGRGAITPSLMPQ